MYVAVRCTLLMSSVMRIAKGDAPAWIVWLAAAHSLGKCSASLEQNAQRKLLAQASDTFAPSEESH